jgi:hypothetical protein
VSPLTYIFNRIIDSGIYPNILKNAKVSPIFKSGENVSLQITGLYLYYPLYPKQLKNISQDICINTWQNTIFYMMPNLVLDQNHSCQTALVNTIDKWIEERNNGNVNVVILLDLKNGL